MVNHEVFYNGGSFDLGLYWFGNILATFNSVPTFWLSPSFCCQPVVHPRTPLPSSSAENLSSEPEKPKIIPPSIQLPESLATWEDESRQGVREHSCTSLPRTCLLKDNICFKILMDLTERWKKNQEVRGRVWLKKKKKRRGKRERENSDAVFIYFLMTFPRLNPCHHPQTFPLWQSLSQHLFPLTLYVIWLVTSYVKSILPTHNLKPEN